MFEIYLFCAVVGGTLLVIQCALTAFGLAESDTDIADDVALDVGELDTGGDLDLAADADADAGELDAGDADTETEHHSTTWLFRMLSFRTLVAATTFFGLSGTASLQAGLTAAVALVVAILMGLCAMVVVHYLMRTLYRLSHDGTVKIGDAVGKPATVYLPIPAARAGAGKVQVCMEDRIMEYQAVSSHDDRLPTGTKVVVVDTVGPAMVEVTPEANQWNRDPLYNASQIALSDKS